MCVTQSDSYHILCEQSFTHLKEITHVRQSKHYSNMKKKYSVQLLTLMLPWLSLNMVNAGEASRAFHTLIVPSAEADINRWWLALYTKPHTASVWPSNAPRSTEGSCWGGGKKTNTDLGHITAYGSGYNIHTNCKKCHNGNLP